MPDDLERLTGLVGEATAAALVNAGVGFLPQIQTVDASTLLHRYDRLKDEAVRQARPQVPLDDELTREQAATIGAERALSWLRDALRLPPGSGGTGAQAARERAYTGQPRAQRDPRLRTDTPETPEKTQSGE
jgi:hypothetical protein